MSRPRLIDRDGVLDAALAIADESGLDAVTMRAVAQRLQVTQMALYRHVENKAGLLDGLVERLLLEMAVERGAGSWQSHLEEMARAVRATARRHPAVFPLLLQLPANTPLAQQVRDRARSELADAGVASARVASAERLLSTAVLGFAASEALGRFRGLSEQDIDGDFALLLRMLADGLRAFGG